MAKVDDLLQAGPKQIILTIVAGLAHGSPPTANLAVKGITNRQNTELKTQENRYPTPAFLQIPILAQLKLQRSINCFRILHGRLIDLGLVEMREDIPYLSIAGQNTVWRN